MSFYIAIAKGFAAASRNSSASVKGPFLPSAKAKQLDTHRVIPLFGVILAHVAV
jgi:hypothetical protein